MGDTFFQIPVVMPLKSSQNIDAWKEDIGACFLIHGLSKFITANDGAPADTAPQEAKDTYTRNKAVAHAIIRQSVEPVMDVIKPFGWTDGTDDPKGLYDMALRKWDQRWADMLSFQVNTGKLTYNGLVRLVSTRANEQLMHNICTVPQTWT